MTNAPQSVTERYISNLIHYGRNRDFAIASVTERENTHEGLVVGNFYTVNIRPINSPTGQASHGATLALAVRHCLQDHGVTFR